MLTAGRIIELARQIARTPGFVDQSLETLNSILSDLCEDYDLAIARGLYEFAFNPSLPSLYGSGPYELPLDYLRVSGSSGEAQKGIWYTYLGVPYPMIPVDLSEFDMQVQQAGLNSYPWLWATDMSNATLAQASRYKKVFVAGLTNNETLMSVSSGDGIDVGDAIAGNGIQPATTLLAIDGVTLTTTGDTHGSIVLDALADTTGVVVGQYVSGTGIPSGTTVVDIVSATEVELSQATTASGTAVTIRFSGRAITLSLPALATLTAASVFTGTAPQAYAYPPPSGAYPITLRYQKMMPPLVDEAQMPWFPNEGYLIDELALRMMELANDPRTTEFQQRAQSRLQRFLGNVDDKRSRPQTVELDRRRFGSRFSGLQNTKQIGW